MRFQCIESPKNSSKLVGKLLLQSYEQHKFVLQIWKLTIDQNTERIPMKNLISSKMEFPPRKIKNATYKNGLKISITFIQHGTMHTNWGL